MKIKKGQTLQLMTKDGDTISYKALRQFDINEAIDEAMLDSPGIPLNQLNQYDGETYLGEWLCAEGIAERLKDIDFTFTVNIKSITQ